MPIQPPPSLAAPTFACMHLICGLGAFHQVVRAINLEANRSNGHPVEVHRLRCTHSVDINPITIAVHSTNYQDTHTVTQNLTDVASWHALAVPSHIMMAGPPCQGWSPAGQMMQWDDPRSVPLALLPMIAWGWGFATAVIEEVSAYVANGHHRWAIL